MTRLITTKAPPACGCPSCSPHALATRWGRPGAISSRRVDRGAWERRSAGMTPSIGFFRAGDRAEGRSGGRPCGGSWRATRASSAASSNPSTRTLEELRRGTVGKQEPFAAVLSCADSRVPVELIFDQSIGRPVSSRGSPANIASTDIIASLEYGVAVLGVATIVVLAHEGCGAVKAAIGGGRPFPGDRSPPSTPPSAPPSSRADPTPRPSPRPTRRSRPVS